MTVEAGTLPRDFQYRRERAESMAIFMNNFGPGCARFAQRDMNDVLIRGDGRRPVAPLVFKTSQGP
jgi:hypothetical protein